jgi:membrane-associated phospholipid phosphatase
MQFLTDFADQAVLVPLALVIGASLALGGAGRAALAWAATMGATLLLVLLLKLAFAACGPLPVADGLANPSGHTAAAAAVYGGLAALVLPFGRATAILAALAAAALIGTSRVALGMHTVADMLAGLAIGTAGAAAFAHLAARLPPPRIRPLALAACAGVALLLHGAHLQAEARIRDAAAFWPFNACRADRSG